MSEDRKIYKGRDPLPLWRALVKGSQGKVNEWIRARRGDDLLAAADAEEKLVALARAVFELPADALDQEALDTLADFNRWLAGKGGRG